MIAQVAVGERRIEVLDLWCEDTKQDAWFTQSALDIGFSWMEKVFPNFHIYLFSGEYNVHCTSGSIIIMLLQLLQEVEHAFCGLTHFQDLRIRQIKIFGHTPVISTGPTLIAAVKLKWLSSIDIT